MQPIEAELKEAHRRSSKHRQLLVAAGNCGCFHCLAEFSSGSIKGWTDQGQTAICPHCGIDAVLPGPVEPEFLRRMRDYWF